jgi:hypothetical protein
MIKNKTTIANKITASKEAVWTSCIEYHDLKIPLVNVFTPKYLTAPYSFNTSITTRNKPENMDTLDNGTIILKKVLELDIPKLLESSI